MKIIKRLISVTMVCVMLISATACGGTDRDEEARKLDIETRLMSGMIIKIMKDTLIPLHQGLKLLITLLRLILCI